MIFSSIKSVYYYALSFLIGLTMTYVVLSNNYFLLEMTDKDKFDYNLAWTYVYLFAYVFSMV